MVDYMTAAHPWAAADEKADLSLTIERLIAENTPVESKGANRAGVLVLEGPRLPQLSLEGTLMAVTSLARQQQQQQQHQQQPIFLLIESADVLRPPTHTLRRRQQLATERRRKCLIELLCHFMRTWSLERLSVVALVPVCSAVPTSRDETGEWVVGEESEGPLVRELMGVGMVDRCVRLRVPMDQQARREVLEVCCRALPVDDKSAVLNEVASWTAGLLPSDIATLTRQAALGAIHRNQSDKSPMDVQRPDFEKALEHVTPAAMKGSLFTYLPFRPSMPSVSPSRIYPLDPATGLPLRGFPAVGGEDELIARLRENVVGPFCRLTSGEGDGGEGDCPPVGIILEGTAGSGKSYLAECLAHECRASVIVTVCADLIRPTVGHSEKVLTSVFRSLRQSAPCILLLEGLDSWAAQPPAADACDGHVDGTSSQDTMGRMKAVLIDQLDEIDRIRRFGGPPLRRTEGAVMVVAIVRCASETDQRLMRPWRLGCAYSTKAPWEWTADDQKALLSLYLQHRMEVCSPAVLTSVLAAIGPSACFSPSLIATACREASVRAVRRLAEATSGQQRDKGDTKAPPSLLVNEDFTSTDR